MSAKNTYSVGCGSIPFGLIGVLFIALKLTGYIDWSWWFVLMPIYLPFAIGLFVVIAFMTLWIWANCRSGY